MPDTEVEVRVLLTEAFERIDGLVGDITGDATLDRLSYRPDQANSASWLVWHLSRVQDDHIADLAGVDQVWSAEWLTRCGLDFDLADIGYGHEDSQVAAVKVPGDVLAEYHERVHEQTIVYIRSLQEDDYERVIDENWDPPVTVRARLVSVLSDCLQHCGQAAYVRGLAERASSAEQRVAE